MVCKKGEGEAEEERDRLVEELLGVRKALVRWRRDCIVCAYLCGLSCVGSSINAAHSGARSYLCIETES